MSGGVCVGLGDRLAFPAEVPFLSAQVSAEDFSHTWGGKSQASQGPDVFAFCVHFPEDADKTGVGCGGWGSAIRPFEHSQREA